VTPRFRQSASQELVASVHDLMAAPTQRGQVTSCVVGGVTIDVMPVQARDSLAAFAVRWLSKHAVSLTSPAVRRFGSTPRSWTLGDAGLRPRNGILNVLWPLCAGERITCSFEPAPHAVSRSVSHGGAAFSALPNPAALLAATLASAWTARPYSKLRRRFLETATATPQHATSLPGIHDGPLAQWRVADPAERAKALHVDKPPPVLAGQLGMFE
jgi:hypothetical protein